MALMIGSLTEAQLADMTARVAARIEAESVGVAAAATETATEIAGAGRRVHRRRGSQGTGGYRPRGCYPSRGLAARQPTGRRRARHPRSERNGNHVEIRQPRGDRKRVPTLGGERACLALHRAACRRDRRRSCRGGSRGGPGHRHDRHAGRLRERAAVHRLSVSLDRNGERSRARYRVGATGGVRSVAPRHVVGPRRGRRLAALDHLRDAGRPR